ncbi:MAG: YfhO family protein [Anaerolineae bacterium]
MEGRKAREAKTPFLPFSRGTVAALGLLALGTAGFFWRLLFTPDVWMPAGGGDLAGFLYPTYHFAARSLRAGQVPLWNPYLYSGAPFVADIQSGIFYPPNLLAFLLTPELTYRTMELLAVAHFFLAGATMYLCLRFLSISASQRLSVLACLAGAVAFMFSDLFITHFGNLNLIAVAAWLPLIFLCYHRALVQRHLGWALGAGLVLGIAALAGHIQPLLHTLLLLGLYLFYRVVLALRDRPRAVLALVGLTALVLALGLGLAALSLIPAYEMTRLTRRAQISYQEASRYSLAPAELVGLLIPGVLGRGVQQYWAPWPRVEVGYIGVFPLLLALLAPLLRRDPLTRFFMSLAVLALLLALGGYGILHGWLYRWVPGFDQIRAPARFIYLLDFALAALAALGLEALLHPLARGPRAVFRRLMQAAPWAFLLLAATTGPMAYAALLLGQDKDPGLFARIATAVNGLAFFLLLLGAGLALLLARRYGRLRSRALGLLAVALIAFDLFSLGAYVDLGTDDPTANFHHPAAIAFLKGDPAPYRVEVRPESWGAWSPDASLLHGLYDVGGIYNPLLLADYQRYWESLTDRSTPLYDFLNAKYVIGPKDFALPWDKFTPVFDGDPQVNIYLNQRALPRALVVYRSQVVLDHEAAWAAIHRPDFDPATTVVLEGGKPLSGPPGQTTHLGFTHYGLNEIRLRVSTTAEGYLVLSEVYYPGWRAYLDGREVEVWRANYAFRALYLPSGDHQVRLVFEPLSWRVGLALSLASLIVLLLLGGWRALRGKGLGHDAR